jgi:hypothetical protein
LQQTLLRMQSDASSLVPFCPDAFRPPGTGAANISIKKKRPALVLLSIAVCPPADLPPEWWIERRAKLVYNTTIGGKA